MDLSIVILNYNTREHLRACLESLRGEGSTSIAGGPIEAEVSSSTTPPTDGSADMVAAEFPWVRADSLAAQRRLRLRQQPGAARSARGDAILLLNPDTLMPPGGIAGTARQLCARIPRPASSGRSCCGPTAACTSPAGARFRRRRCAFYRFSGLSRLFPRSPRFGRYNLTYRRSRSRPSKSTRCAARACWSAARSSSASACSTSASLCMVKILTGACARAGGLDGAL